MRYYCFFYSFVDLPKKLNIFFCKQGFTIAFVLKINKVIYLILKYAASAIMLSILIYEIVFNNMTLHKTLVLAPYYASYQMVFLSSYFIMKRMLNKFDVEIVEYMFTDKADSLRDKKRYFFLPSRINIIGIDLRKYILDVLKKY